MGLRIWVGKEQEGQYVGKKTLFVETQKLTESYVQTILRFAESQDTKRIYFGAGKNELLQYDTSQFQKIAKLGYDIVIECLFINRAIYDNILHYISQLILRIECEMYDLNKKYSIKIDDNRNVSVYLNPWVNHLKNVQNGVYTQIDKILWEE